MTIMYKHEYHAFSSFIFNFLWEDSIVQAMIRVTLATK